MDAIKNPFSPGYGSPPPELVGRKSILESARIHSGEYGGFIVNGDMARGICEAIMLDNAKEKNRHYAY